MVRVTRISATPASALSLQINDSTTGAVLDHLEATAAAEGGPTWSATVSDETAAKLQEDAGLAAHFRFEPIKDAKPGKPARKRDGE